MVCRQLGYKFVKSVYENSYFGPVTDPFSFRYTYCSGFEDRLEDCDTQSGFSGDSDCGWYDVAGVQCSYDDPKDDDPTSEMQIFVTILNDSLAAFTIL